MPWQFAELTNCGLVLRSRSSNTQESSHRQSLTINGYWSAADRVSDKQMISRIFIILTLFVCSISTQAQTLKKVASIDLPGPKGQRFDYLTMDDEDHWLLSAHLGPGILYVIDAQTNKLVQAIPGVPGITGVEYVLGFRKVYTSDWGEEKIGVVSLQSMT